MAINFPDSPSVNDIHTSGDMSWKWDGTTWKATITTSVPLPSQSGQAGEFLQTDGTTMTWEAVDHTHSHASELPSQTGQAGEYLKTDGTTATWEPAGGGYDTATTSTGYFDIPVGTTAQRPGTPATGNLRLNTDTLSAEIYNDGSWIGFAGSTPTISSIGPTTAAETGTTVTVTGTNFQAGAVVKLIGTNAVQIQAASTTVNSTTEIQFTTPALVVANEPYDVKVVNTNGGSATLSDILDAGGLPSWTTAAGLLGTITDDATGTHFTLVATDPDGTAVTFTETTSVLTTAGLVLNSTTGAITGDPTNQTIGSPTTYAFDIDASDGVNTTSRSFSITVVTQEFNGSTGGTETTITDGGVTYKVHTFLTGATFNPGNGGTLDKLLVVAGGGGGSGDLAGGGGAGGYRDISNFAVAASTVINVTVGPGGARGVGNDNPTALGTKGTNSTFSTISATGGGRGGREADGNGGHGGSGAGGGGSGGQGPGSGNEGGYSPVEGYDGGDSSSVAANKGSGGGGSAAKGQDHPSNAGGYGGAGTQNNIDGNNYYWAGGGGGSNYGTSGGMAGAGGIGGGGGGSANEGAPAGSPGGGGLGGGSAINSGGDGAANTSGGFYAGNGGANTGGGGGATGEGPGGGGNGGSGIVILRYVWYG